MLNMILLVGKFFSLYIKHILEHDIISAMVFEDSVDGFQRNTF